MSKSWVCVEGEEAISIFQRLRQQRDCFVSHSSKTALFPRNDVATLILIIYKI